LLDNDKSHWEGAGSTLKFLQMVIIGHPESGFLTI